jgi:hypothetical protein
MHLGLGGQSPEELIQVCLCSHGIHGACHRCIKPLQTKQTNVLIHRDLNNSKFWKSYYFRIKFFYQNISDNNIIIIGFFIENIPKKRLINLDLIKKLDNILNKICYRIDIILFIIIEIFKNKGYIY